MGVVMSGPLARSLRLLVALLLAAVVVRVPAAWGADPEQEKKDGTEKKSEGSERSTQVERVEVNGRADDMLGIASSASEGATGRNELMMRPILRTGELLETVPGLIVTQHSGEGKANQYFLRGFNLDPGTDFRVTVGGIPVNMPSHGHGQGYADLTFLIPELVDTVQYRKGPYFAEEGDFSAAGAVRIEYIRSLPDLRADVTGGSFGYQRALVAGSARAGGGDLLAAGEFAHDDGPWERPDDFRRANGLVRFSRGDAARGFSVTAQGTEAIWDSTDQVPQRAVEEGLLDRFGAVDPSDGGSSARYALSGELHRGSTKGLSSLDGYLLDSRLELFSNFTYLLDDPINGDQFEQEDRRRVAGLSAARTWFGSWSGRRVESSVGLQLRGDWIHNGLFSTRERHRLSTTREDRIVQMTGGPYAQTLIHWNDKVRSQIGLRADLYRADVDSDLDLNSGQESDAIVSPKLALAFGPWRSTETYVNFGMGFHSNDARGATIQVDPKTGLPARAVTPLVRATGAEVGVRTSALRGLRSSVSAFALDLDSELIFVGDAGSTEAGRPSRRVGLEWANFYQRVPWLAVDVDLAATRARFTDDDPAGDRIPGAIERVASAGVSVEGLRGFSGSLRLRYFGPRPLVEDDSVRSGATQLLNARVGYQLPRGVRLDLDLFNLLDSEASDIDDFYASRLPGEPAGGVEDIHFHPVEPRSIRLLVSWSI